MPTGQVSNLENIVIGKNWLKLIFEKNFILKLVNC